MTKFRPANGTEGEAFMEAFCFRCALDNFNEETGDGGCRILADSLAFGINDHEYPKEWQLDADGYGICTAFRLRANEGAGGGDDV